jgi:hypothetical protein
LCYKLGQQQAKVIMAKSKTQDGNKQMSSWQPVKAMMATSKSQDDN